ncbi:MAG TPA: hypothetical protein VNK43_12290 [Gemmatimonadales bacterium]|nr:hypothetical protein [Gemmatimonadales bacterium]
MTAPTVRSPGIAILLGPKWRSGLARLRRGGEGRAGRLVLLGLLAAGFWAAIFGISQRVLRHFRGVPDLGDALAAKVLAVTFLAFLSILLLSNLITALSTFFLAKDLDTLVAAPVDWLHFYLAKLTETVAHSSWMVALLAVPIFTAYGIVYDGGPLFPLVSAAAFLPFLVIPAVAGTALTQVLVNVFPARRTRDVLSLVAIAGAGALVLLLRLARPEQLARPEGFRNLLEFLAALRAPTNPFLPSEWAADLVMNWLLRVPDPLPIALLWTTAAAFVVLGAAAHRALYLAGFSKAQEGAERAVRVRGWERVAERLLVGASPARREFILKDLRLFFRDTTQWSQLILLAVLMVVYLFNIQALPLYTGERVPFFLVTMVSFLNQGLTGFVLAAVAARFVFPAVSLEGKQMWLLRSSPLDLRAMLWSKYWVGTAPLLVLGLLMTWTTNWLLQASWFMVGIATLTVALYTAAVAALALALGVLYPRFDTENAAQIPTSFGGLVFMMAAILLLGLLIVIEAGPVADHLRARWAGRGDGLGWRLAGALGLVTVLCALVGVGSFRLAVRRLEAMEF